MYVFKKHVSRRTVLKGVGATIALPLLDAMNPAATAWAQTAAGAPPRRLAFVGFTHGAIMAFDFDQRGPQTWDIDIVTDEGTLKLSMGAGRMAIDGVAQDVGAVPEYTVLYQHFARLLKDRCSDADFTPLKHVADAFLLGRRTSLTPFHWA